MRVMPRPVWRFGIAPTLVVLTLSAVGFAPLAVADAASGGDDVTIVLSSAGKYDADRFDKTVDAVQARVENLRDNRLLEVDDASVSRRGHDIVVRLSGVNDPAAAQDLIVPTPLYFRPVLANVPPATGSQADDPAARRAVASCDPAAISALSVLPTTTPTDDRADACVVLPTRDGTARLLLGPAALVGSEDVARARPRTSSPGYAVLVTLRKQGLSRFNALAAQSSKRPAPNNQVGIAIGGVVQANPGFQASNFKGDIAISGDFSESEATDLAHLINYGSFPVTVKRVAVN